MKKKLDPIVESLYKQVYSFKQNDGSDFPVSVEGSLALLAEGYKGVIALRKLRIEKGYKNPNDFIVRKDKQSKDGEK